MRLLILVMFTAALAACTDSAKHSSTPRLEDFRGQWLLINYWAQWCKPCIQEIPELNQINREFSQVSVLGVNFDGITGEALETQIQKLGVDFPNLALDPAAELGVSRPQVLPTTLVLDPSGQLSQTLIGPQTLSSLAAATGQSLPDGTTSVQKKYSKRPQTDLRHPARIAGLDLPIVWLPLALPPDIKKPARRPVWRNLSKGYET